MKPSNAAAALVRQFEGLRLVAYLCPANVWTIGYGHTKGVKKGDVCTIAQAEAFLMQDLDEAAAPIRKLVKKPLTQNQFDALCSFILNVGGGNFAASSMLTAINRGDYKGAAAQFGRWVHGGGKRLPGLVMRRAAECDLFTKE
jgi:lysozyme